MEKNYRPNLLSLSVATKDTILIDRWRRFIIWHTRHMTQMNSVDYHEKMRPESEINVIIGMTKIFTIFRALLKKCFKASVNAAMIQILK